jgi:hypothetical protein
LPPDVAEHFMGKRHGAQRAGDTDGGTPLLQKALGRYRFGRLAKSLGSPEMSDYKHGMEGLSSTDHEDHLIDHVGKLSVLQALRQDGDERARAAMIPIAIHAVEHRRALTGSYSPPGIGETLASLHSRH